MNITVNSYFSNLKLLFQIPRLSVHLSVRGTGCLYEKLLDFVCSKKKLGREFPLSIKLSSLTVLEELESTRRAGTFWYFRIIKCVPTLPHKAQGWITNFLELKWFSVEISWISKFHSIERMTRILRFIVKSSHSLRKCYCPVFKLTNSISCSHKGMAIVKRGNAEPSLVHVWKV